MTIDGAPPGWSFLEAPIYLPMKELEQDVKGIAAHLHVPFMFATVTAGSYSYVFGGDGGRIDWRGIFNPEAAADFLGGVWALESMRLAGTSPTDVDVIASQIAEWSRVCPQPVSKWRVRRRLTDMRALAEEFIGAFWEDLGFGMLPRRTLPMIP